MTERPTDPMEWVPAAAGGICVAVLDDQAVLYDTGSARPVLLNITASAVWAEIDGQRTVAQISDELARRFGAEPTTVAADVLAALASFQRLGLLGEIPDRHRPWPSR
jgi:hypothetical protein